MRMYSLAQCQKRLVLEMMPEEDLWPYLVLSQMCWNDQRVEYVIPPDPEQNLSSPTTRILQFSQPEI